MLRRVEVKWCILLLCLMQGCKLFKEVKTTAYTDDEQAKVKARSNLSLDHNAQTEQHFLEWKLDSLNSTEVLQIWPRGRFTFSPERGFEGEADRLVLTSGSKNVATVLQRKDSLVKVQDKVKAETQLQAAQKAVKKNTVKTESPSFWVIAGMLLLVIVTGYALKRAFT